MPRKPKVFLHVPTRRTRLIKIAREFAGIFGPQDPSKRKHEEVTNTEHIPLPDVGGRKLEMITT